MAILVGRPRSSPSTTGPHQATTMSIAQWRYAYSLKRLAMVDTHGEAQWTSCFRGRRYIVIGSYIGRRVHWYSQVEMFFLLFCFFFFDVSAKGNMEDILWIYIRYSIKSKWILPVYVKLFLFLVSTVYMLICIGSAFCFCHNKSLLI